MDATHTLTKAKLTENTAPKLIFTFTNSHGDVVLHLNNPFSISMDTWISLLNGGSDCIIHAPFGKIKSSDGVVSFDIEIGAAYTAISQTITVPLDSLKAHLSIVLLTYQQKKNGRS